MQCLKSNKGLNKGYLLSDASYSPSSSLPLPEHPNPFFSRPLYASLNGLWDFARSKEKNLPSFYQKKIRVPFAVETIESLVNRLVSPDDYLFYHRVIELPKDFDKERVLIHFLGVDQFCDVFLGSQLVLSHEGGRTPFVLEVPSSSFPLDLTLRVKDLTDSSYQTNGKQTLNPGGWKYSSSSGVYRPIYRENVPSSHLESLLFTEDIDKGGVKVLAKANKEGTCSLLIDGKEYSVPTGKETFLPLTAPLTLWSRENPYLYMVKASFRGDTVSSYFGLRKREIKEKDGFRRLYLNGKPLFLSGLLDQGYYSSSRLTPTSYSQYLFDIKKSLDLGFNCLRIHRKVEIPYFYYLADKRGRLLIQDYPCGGYSPSFASVVAPRLFPFLSKEKHIPAKKTGRNDKASLLLFEKERKEYLPLFHNHPSIIRQTIFNEGWGENKPSYFYSLAKQIDPKRIFDSASGWYEAEKSDVFSIHTYTLPKRKRKNTYNRLFLLSEIGGIGLKRKGFPYPKRFGHKNVRTKEELEEKRTHLYQKEILPQIKKYGLSGVIYTQLSDCEEEANGLFDYTRSQRKVKEETRKELNECLYQEFNQVRK